MKRFLPILFLTVVSLLTFSCSSDDGAPASSNIVGTWEYYRGGGILNGEEILMPWEHLCPSQKDKLEILGNNTIKAYNYEEDCSLDLGQGTYTYSGNRLTVTMDGETSTAEVMTLTDTTLKLKIPEPDSPVNHIIVELKRI